MLWLEEKMTPSVSRDRTHRVAVRSAGLLLTVSIATLVAGCAPPVQQALALGSWHAWLDSPGGAVHSGFSGPASGAAYTELRAKFGSLIEELLAEADTRS